MLGSATSPEPVPQRTSRVTLGALMLTFQEMILRLQRYWADYGCLLVQPYGSEVGAGTFNPHTFLRAIGPEPWNVAYVEPSRRPTDGRYGDNPNRLQHFHQYQVILKPSPLDIQARYLESLQVLGIDLSAHDVRFVEDDWESPTLGAWGLGWQVWLDGLEISQFTYFQQVGSLECSPIAGELTYGLERIGMHMQNVSSVYELEWGAGVAYAELAKRAEWEWSTYNFEAAETDMLTEQFTRLEAGIWQHLGAREAQGVVHYDKAPLERLVLPAYDYVIKCSHAFNLLDARGAVSVTERQRYIGRVRKLARLCAESWLAQREALGFPLLAGAEAQKTFATPSPETGNAGQREEVARG